MASIRRFCRKNIHYIFICLFAAALVFAAFNMYGQNDEHVVINEVCSTNATCCEDENGEFPDWVEIYNPTDRDVDISGYMLNDSGDLLEEHFIIPEGTVLASGAFYLFDPHFLISSDGVPMNLLDRRRRYVDRIEIPKLKYDTTWARTEDGSDDWSIKEPTPGYSNSDGKTLQPTVDGSVNVSKPPGFYEDDFDLKLTSTNLGWDVYYTTDGSDPKKKGVLYSEAIRIYDRSDEENVYAAIEEVSPFYLDGSVKMPTYPVDKCTVIRAVAKDPLGRYTEESIYTYFVGFDKKNAYAKMPVVSAVADPDNLFSKENGILVLGQKYDDYVAAGEPEDYEGSNANLSERGRGSERPVNIEIYNEDHLRVLKTDAGIRVKGMSTRWDPQKSFSIIFRRAYAGNFKEKFTIYGTDINFHSIALDKGGQDAGTKMKDTIMEECMSTTDCATTTRYPCCLFLNGEYWGFYWLTQKFDNSYIADKYGVNKDEVMYKNITEFEDGEWRQDDFDRQSLIDCYVANIIIARGDSWPHYNFRVWKTMDYEENRFGDGKYRPVIFDANSNCMEDYDRNMLEYLAANFYPFMEACDDDPDFRRDIVARLNEMCDNEFNRDKILNMIDDMYVRIHDQMILDHRRYVDCTEEESEKFFDENVSILREFYRNRNDVVKKQGEKFLNAQ